MGGRHVEEIGRAETRCSATSEEEEGRVHAAQKKAEQLEALLSDVITRRLLFQAAKHNVSS